MVVNKMNKGITLKLLIPSCVAFCVALFLSSCLPDPLEVEGIPVVTPTIVVSSQIVPEESVVILLTKSFGALDASEDSDPQTLLDQIAVTDALVLVEHGGITDTLGHLGNGIYGGVDVELVPGIDYNLRVTSVSLGTVTATTQVKPQVQFTDVEAILYPDSFDDTLAQVTYSFRDPAPENNWYMINAIKVERDDLEENLLDPRDFVLLRDDALFNGGAYTETFRIFPREFSEGDTLALYLSNVSEEYYDFLQMRIDNRLNLVEFISEPLNYPTNVKGGLGFFNLNLPDVRIVFLEE